MGSIDVGPTKNGRVSSTVSNMPQHLIHSTNLDKTLDHRNVVIHQINSSTNESIHKIIITIDTYLQWPTLANNQKAYLLYTIHH